MPGQKSPLSLVALSGIATCRLVRNALHDLSCESLSLADKSNNDVPVEAATVHLDKKCTAIAEHLKAKVHKTLLTDLANVYLPKLCAEATQPGVERMDVVCELLNTICVFLKCQLQEVSFWRLIPPHSPWFGTPIQPRYSATCLLLHWNLTTPDLFGRLEVLDLINVSWRESLFCDVMQAIATHGKHLTSLTFDAPLQMTIGPRALEHFVPRRNDEGAFIEPMPCPKLRHCVIRHVLRLDMQIVVDFLFTHPNFSYLGCLDGNGQLLDLMCQRILGSPDVFGDWKSSLENMHIGVSSLDRVNSFSRFFPRLITLEVDLPDSQLLELVPLMGRLKQLSLTTCAAYGQIGGNAVDLLQRHGQNLVTLQLVCLSMSSTQLKTVAQGCPNVTKLALTFGHLKPQGSNGMGVDVPLFSKLKALKLKVGDGVLLRQTDAGTVTTFLRVLLKNKPCLERFILESQQPADWMNDQLASEWITGSWTMNLRDVSLSGDEPRYEPREHFPLTDAALACLLTLPNIARITELKWWSVGNDAVLSRQSQLRDAGVDLDLVWAEQWRRAGGFSSWEDF